MSTLTKVKKMETKISEFNFGIFDVHGTLLDNLRLYRVFLRAASTFIIRNGEPYLPTAGMPVPCWVETLCNSPSLVWVTLRIEKVLAIFFESIATPNPKLFEGAREVLLQLYNNGIKLFATTGGKTSTTEAKLKKLGINDFFLGLSGRELPKREHIPYFARCLDLPLKKFSQQAFLVSDGSVDLALAKKYGVYGIGITNTLTPALLRAAGAKEVITNLRELRLKH